ncbi:hypothetical protein, partial [Chromobacterium piscinae]|uniref:hypothetical protein n=1 Tax=Chromobacterium piscinae TaxID=686831 RepID=UPI003F7F6AE2
DRVKVKAFQLPLGPAFNERRIITMSGKRHHPERDADRCLTCLPYANAQIARGTICGSAIGRVHDISWENEVLS